MTHSPVVAPRQVELLVTPLSGTIGARFAQRSATDPPTPDSSPETER